MTGPALPTDLSTARSSCRRFVWRLPRKRRSSNSRAIRASFLHLVALALFIPVCEAQQLPPASAPIPELRRGPDGQIEVIPSRPGAPGTAPGARPQPVQPKPETVQPAPAVVQPQPVPTVQSQPQPASAPPVQSPPAAAPPPAPAVGQAAAQPQPAASPAAPDIKLPEPLAIELPAGVSVLSPSELPFSDFLLRASSEGRRVSYDLSHPVGVGPVEVTWTAWDRGAGADRVAATKTATVFVLPNGMTPAGESGSQDATTGNNAAKIARDAAGRVHLVWNTSGQDVSAHVLYRRGTTDADGAVVWDTDPAPVENAAVSWDSFPSLAVSGETVHIAWQAGGTVHYRRIAHSSGGWQWGPEHDLGAASGGRDVGPAIDAVGSTVDIATPSGYYARSADDGDTWAVETIPLPPDTKIKTESIAADRLGNAHIAFSGVVGKVPPGDGGYWELRYVRRAANGAWLDARNALAGAPEWAAGPGDHLADWVRILVDDDDNIHLTWHGTAISRVYANDQSYYAFRRATGPGTWEDGWEPPVRLMPLDPAKGIGFSYAPSLALGDEAAAPVTFYDVGKEGFDSAARIVRQGKLDGPPIQVTGWMQTSIAAKDPKAALSARFPAAAPRLFYAPDGRIWLDVLETLIPVNVNGTSKLIVYQRIDVTDAIEGRWSANGIWFRLRHAVAAAGQGVANIANHLFGHGP
jgi:hypothetical protein